MNKNKIDQILKWLKNTYQLTIYNKESLEQVLTAHITKLKVLQYAIVFAFAISIIVGLLFIYTPLNNFLPVQQTNKITRQLINHSYKLDSLEKEVLIRDKYFENMQNIMNGKELDNYEAVIDTSIRNTKLEFAPSKHDSILRKEVERKEKHGLSSIVGKSGANYTLKNLHFFTPVKGIITNKFDPASKHVAVDIVAEPNEPVLSTLEGTVTVATWSLNTGYVIAVQHSNNLMSIYKHNSSLLKEEGDRVNAGEPIAIIGNTGELSTGTHLHFELWHNGTALNPEHYLTF